MASWGCCTPGRIHTHMGGKVVQLRRAAVLAVKRNLLVAPVAVGAGLCWVKSYTPGAPLGPAWGKVPMERRAHCRSAPSAQAAAAPEPVEEAAPHQGPTDQRPGFPPAGASAPWAALMKGVVAAAALMALAVSQLCLQVRELLAPASQLKCPGRAVLPRSPL